MKKLKIYLTFIIVTAFLSISYISIADEEQKAKEETKTNRLFNDKIKLKGSLWEYYVNENYCYFGNTSSVFLESTARLGADIKFTEDFSADILINGQHVAGDPCDYTGVEKNNIVVETELANAVLSNIFNKPLSLTVGRQNLEYGDGFLVYDGYSDTRAVWTQSMRSFDAIKVVYDFEPVQWDVFASMVNRYNDFIMQLTSYYERNTRMAYEEVVVCGSSQLVIGSQSLFGL